MNTIIRIFIAIELDNHWRTLLQKQVKLFRQSLSSQDDKQFHWVPETNWHITLRFIGAFDKPRLSQLIETLHNYTSFFKSFRLNIYETWCVQLLPRVLALSILPNPELLNLQSALEQACQSLGMAAEYRSYLPHITLGYFKDFSSPILLPPFFTELRLPPLRIKQYSLFESVILQEQRIYQRVRDFPLIV